MIKGVTQTIESETKEQRGRFLDMLLGTLSALGSMLVGEGVIRVGDGVHRVGRIFIASSFFDQFEIQKYYQNKPRFKGVYSQSNLPNTMEDGALCNKS